MLQVRSINAITASLLALFLSLGPAIPAGAQEKEEKTSGLQLKTVEGVQFLVEPDREIEHDPITGILIPEPIDRYVSRKYKSIQKEFESEIARLEELIQALEAKIAGLENVLRRPLLAPQAEAP